MVDELIIRDTHTNTVDWMLPGVVLTLPQVEVAFVVSAGNDDDAVSYQHIYWDQTSVLIELGLLNPEGLPVVASEPWPSCYAPLCLIRLSKDLMTARHDTQRTAWTGC